MELEFAVSLWILGFMEKKNMVLSSYNKNCQTQSVHHTFTLKSFPINSALVILDMTPLCMPLNFDSYSSNHFGDFSI